MFLRRESMLWNFLISDRLIFFKTHRSAILNVVEQFEEINEKDNYLFRFKKGRDFYKIPISKNFIF